LKLRKNDIIDLSEPTRILAECGRTPVEAASDYLRCLWEHVKKQIINEHSRAVYDYAEKSIVLSVPAIWSDAAKHNTYLVAAGAGLAAEEYRLQIVSEPEAAAIAVLKDRSGRLKVRAARCEHIMPLLTSLAGG
jgi:molecular chaperone DnaK (HSP70)